jgi:hypothetical protein
MNMRSFPIMSADSAADSAFPFAAFWTNYLEQADAQSKAILECFQNLGDPQQMQKRWLEMLSRNLDGYMRSPAFLEAMQRNLKAMTDLKSFQDQMVQDVARHVGVPLASDVYGLFERLHSVEQTILRQLRMIEGRLATIETKLGFDRNTR